MTRTYFSLISFFFFILIVSSNGCQADQPVPVVEEQEETVEQLDPTMVKLKEKAGLAFDYVLQKGYSNRFCILVDMDVHSGKERMYVWDFILRQVVDKGLVSHGSGSNQQGEDETKDNPSFSNVNGSLLTSLGKYKIGVKGSSSWGVGYHYKLLGLENTNSNAYIRNIVLHSWDDIQESPVFPNGTPEGAGCPAVSNSFMTRLDAQISNAGAPILFWIYN